jgi:hypothetical protein
MLSWVRAVEDACQYGRYTSVGGSWLGLCMDIGSYGMVTVGPFEKISPSSEQCGLSQL